MKPLKSPTLYSRLALITSVTLVVGYFVVYAAWTGILDSEIAPSATVTSTLMTKIRNNLDYLSGGLANFGFSSGNVGIGTVSPAGKFHILTTSAWVIPSTSGDELVMENSGDAGLSILGGAANSSYMLFGDSGSASAWIIQYYHADPSLRLRAVEAGSYLTLSTANTERVRVSTTGNVGIGTIAPSQRLDLWGGVIGDGNIGGGLKIGGGNFGSSGSCILSAYSDQSICPAGWTRLAPGLCAKCQ